MRIALAQINPTVGDIAGNEARVREQLARAREAGAQLVALPRAGAHRLPARGPAAQGALPAPTRGPRVERSPPTAAGHRRGRRLPRARRGRLQRRGGAAPTAACGGLPQGQPAQLRRLRRACATSSRGPRRRARRRRRRHGRAHDLRGHLGPGAADADEALAGARLIVNISASPYHAGKGREREQMIAQRARDNLAAVAFCALVGGQDELVFDGHSFVVDHDGRGDRARAAVRRGAARLRRRRRRRRAPPACATRASAAGRARARRRPSRTLGRVRDRQPRLRADADAGGDPVAELLDADAEIYAALVLGTRDYVRKNGFEHVVLGPLGRHRLGARGPASRSTRSAPSASPA